MEFFFYRVILNPNFEFAPKTRSSQKFRRFICDKQYLFLHLRLLLFASGQILMCWWGVDHQALIITEQVLGAILQLDIELGVLIPGLLCHHGNQVKNAWILILYRALILLLLRELSFSHSLGQPLDGLLVIILIASDDVDSRLSPLYLASFLTGELAQWIVVLSILDALVLSVRLVSCLRAVFAQVWIRVLLSSLFVLQKRGALCFVNLFATNFVVLLFLRHLGGSGSKSLSHRRIYIVYHWLTKGIFVWNWWSSVSYFRMWWLVCY